MRFHKVDTSTEKLMLIGMITSDRFMKRIRPIYDPDYLDVGAVKTVAEWVVNYYDKYEKAPQRAIEDIFKRSSRRLGQAEAEWIEDFLTLLNAEYEETGINEDYLFDQVVGYFKRQKLRKSAERVIDLVSAGKEDQAEDVWHESMVIPGSGDLGVDPFDPSYITHALDKEEHRVTLTLGIKSIDDMVGSAKSGWLVLFLAPMKRGKTWMMSHMAIRSVVKGLNTVFISLETEAEDGAERLWMNIGSLTKEKEELRFPYFTNPRTEEVEYELVKRPQLSLKNILASVKTFRKVARGRLRLKSFPMGSAGIKEIKNYLNLLEVYEGFQPHVIIVDYLGAMKMPRLFGDGDTAYNRNSILLKALAQEKQAIVYSGHQATRDTLKKWSINPEDTSQDIRIFANVDMMFGLNQTTDEMDEGIIRVNVLGHRHRRFTRNKEAKILQQLGAGQVVLDDRLVDKPTVKKGNLYGGEGKRNQSSSQLDK